MPTGCGIRALWILNSHDAVVFSRSLSLWRAACKSEIEHNGGSVDGMASPYLPSDSELVSSFAERKKSLLVFRLMSLLVFLLIFLHILNTSINSLYALKVGSRPLNKDAIRTYISSSMPFADLPPADVKQPAWKPYLYQGKQKILFTIHETVAAALYDRDEIPDSISVSGQVNCRAELEGLPDVSLPLTGLNSSHIESLSFHPSAQVPEPGADKQSVMISPLLGNFVLMHYQASCGLGRPIKGFYQLSMVFEDEDAFLFRLSLIEGYKAPLTMDFFSFLVKRIIAVDGTPSVGTISTTEHSVEWKLLVSGRGLFRKSIEATFPGTVKFAPWQIQRLPFTKIIFRKHGRGRQIAGASLSGISIDPKSVKIYFSVKAPMEFLILLTLSLESGCPEVFRL
ncbi:hypothetical protein ACJRO7_010404 [Eucalyptus globulus]|uniref:MHD domain-containing protein n=1 Tax=Eucalyptus globulus TaxID=34317 RepID=A0ABD3LGM3_EUCGL